MAMTLADLMRSGKTPEEINAILSGSTVGSGTLDPNFMAGEPYMPPQQSQPMNSLVNMRTGREVPLLDSMGRPSQSQMQRPIGDMSQNPVDTPFGRGYYMKGDNTRVVLADGRIADLGRDTGRERAMMKDDLGIQKQRAELAQTNIENKAKQSALDEAGSLMAGSAMTAKQYEARHGRIPSGFEIYRTETGETDIRPVQGGKQYLELQDRVHKFDSSGKGMDEYGTQLDKLVKHPGRESATGFSSITNSLALPGGDAKDFLNELETFQSQAFLSNIDKLRGTGPLSNVEGEKLQAAVGNLNVSSNEETFKKNLLDVKRRFESLKEKAKMDADNARGEMKRGGVSGGMVVDVSGEKMALSLPAGTKFRLPDGRTGTAR